MKAFSRFNRSMGLNLCWLFLVFGTNWMAAEQTVATHRVWGRVEPSISE